MVTQPKRLKKRLQVIKKRKAEQKMDPFAQTIKQFCRPLFAVADQLSGLENAVSLGIFAWNAAFLPEEKWRHNFRTAVARLGLTQENCEALEGIIEELIRQKELLHPGDMRVVTKYETNVVQDDAYISVESTLATKQLIPSKPASANP